MELDLTAFGGRIRKARELAGLSQAELGRRMETSQTDISRWERGVVMPRLSTLLAIAKACGVSTDWLLTGRNEEQGDMPPSVAPVAGAAE